MSSMKVPSNVALKPVWRAFDPLVVTAKGFNCNEQTQRHVVEALSVG